jgi:1-acyl-sn-glycerol-3-phosphate acyltransferase
VQVPFPYLIARAVVRAALAIYFRGLDVSGSKNVPAKGPVILAANHPQSVTDAMVLAAAAPRAVNFIAHSGLFENPLRGWLLRSCGVIPVYIVGKETRAADGNSAGEKTRAGMTTRASRKEPQDQERPAVQKNVEMFSACEKALVEGGAIGIFPEGVSTEERRVHALKTGTARIALQTESGNEWRSGVSVVPVGLSFESRRRMRTRIYVAFGEAIPATRYREAHKNDPVEAARSMSADLEKAISRLVVDIERPEFDALVREVDLIYKKELLARDRLSDRGREGVRAKGREDRRARGREEIRAKGREGARARGREAAGLGHEIDVEIPRALDFFLERRPETVRRVRRLLAGYRAALEKARTRDDSLRESAEKTLFGELARMTAFGAAGLPIAAYGTLWNYVPYRFAGFVAHGAAKDETKIHYYQIVCGAVFFPLWYAPAIYLASRILIPWGAVIFAVSLPLSGLFAHGFARWFVRRGRTIRYIRLRMTHGRVARELERRRKLVIAELDIAFAEYIAQRLEAPPAPAGEERSG